MNRVPTLLLAASLATLGTAADAASINRQVPVGAGGRVKISNVAGSVTITTWERREVDVQGELNSGVERVDVLQAGNDVNIEVVIRQGAQRRGDADLRIRLPKDVVLEATTVSASLEVGGVQGRVRLRTISGDIRSGMLGEDLQANSISGDIQITGGSARSRIHAFTVSGQLVINQGAGDLELRSTSGDLRVLLNGADHTHVSTVSGRILVSGGLSERASLDVESVSGPLRVITPTAGIRYDASSYSGRVNSCFNDTVQRSKYGGRTRVEGERGSGGAFVVARSHSGSVEICDR